MSESQANKYGNWQEAAQGGNLASYALANAPGREDLVPGAKPDDNPLLRGLDYASMPARLLTNALLGPVQVGGEALRRWQAGDQSPETMKLITEAVGGMALNGLGVSNPLRMRPNELLAIPGYHGTPHTFAPEPGAPLGSFRSEKIGSGEGAQSYGWGHYVAEREGVARAYQENLSANRGATFSHPSQIVPDWVEDILKGFDTDFRAANPNKFETNIDKYINGAREWLERDIAERKHRGTVTIGNESRFDPGLLPKSTLERIEKSENGLAWLDRFGKELQVQPAPTGNLYHVEVRPDKHELLDWDQPFARHSPQVQEGVLRAVRMAKIATNIADDISGKDIYMHLTRATGNPRKASELLHEAGVPGLQFWDQASRRMGEPVIAKKGPDADGKFYWDVSLNQDALSNQAAHNNSFWTLEEARAWAKANDPRTRNFVVFHPQNLRITGANGKSLDYVPVSHDPFTGTPLP